MSSKKSSVCSSSSEAPRNSETPMSACLKAGFQWSCKQLKIRSRLCVPRSQKPNTRDSGQPRTFRSSLRRRSSKLQQAKLASSPYRNNVQHNNVNQLQCKDFADLYSSTWHRDIPLKRASKKSANADGSHKHTNSRRNLYSASDKNDPLRFEEKRQQNKLKCPKGKTDRALTIQMVQQQYKFTELPSDYVDKRSNDILKLCNGTTDKTGVQYSSSVKVVKGNPSQSLRILVGKAKENSILSPSSNDQVEHFDKELRTPMRKVNKTTQIGPCYVHYDSFNQKSVIKRCPKDNNRTNPVDIYLNSTELKQCHQLNNEANDGSCLSNSTVNTTPGDSSPTKQQNLKYPLRSCICRLPTDDSVKLPCYNFASTPNTKKEGSTVGTDQQYMLSVSISAGSCPIKGVTSVKTMVKGKSSENQAMTDADNSNCVPNYEAYQRSPRFVNSPSIACPNIVCLRPTECLTLNSAECRASREESSDNGSRSVAVQSSNNRTSNARYPRLSAKYLPASVIPPSSLPPLKTSTSICSNAEFIGPTTDTHSCLISSTKLAAANTTGEGITSIYSPQSYRNSSTAVHHQQQGSNNHQAVLSQTAVSGCKMATTSVPPPSRPATAQMEASSCCNSKQAFLFGDMVEKDIKTFRKSIESQQLELQRMQACLNEERRRADELRSNQELNDTNLHLLVNTLKNQKVKLEQRNAMLEESLQTAHSSLEVLRQQLHTSEEDWNTQRADYRNALTVLEKELEQVIQEKAHAQMMWAQICDEKKKLETAAAQRCLEYDNEISELRSKCDTLEEVCAELRQNLEVERSKHLNDASEWQDFQRDLQTAVRVANDLKIEAEERAEHLELEIYRLKRVECALAGDLASLTTSTTDSQSGRSSSNHQDIPSKTPNTSSSFHHGHHTTSSATVSRMNYDMAGRTPIKDIIKRLEASMKASKSEETNAKYRANMERKSVDKRVQKRHFSCKFPHDDSDALHPCFNSGCPQQQSTQSGAHGTTTDDVKFITRSQSLNRQYQCRGSNDSKLNFGPQTTTQSVTQPQNESCQWSSSSNSAASIINPMGCNQQIGDDKYNVLSALAMKYPQKGSRRNALLKWCRECTQGYKGVDITNFSSSWSTGNALLALVHSLMPDKIPYDQLAEQNDPELKFRAVFAAVEQCGINAKLDLKSILYKERPPWEPIMDYVTEIYRHFGHHHPATDLPSMSSGQSPSSLQCSRPSLSSSRCSTSSSTSVGSMAGQFTSPSGNN